MSPLFTAKPPNSTNNQSCQHGLGEEGPSMTAWQQTQALGWRGGLEHPHRAGITGKQCRSMPTGFLTSTVEQLQVWTGKLLWGVTSLRKQDCGLSHPLLWVNLFPDEILLEESLKNISYYLMELLSLLLTFSMWICINRNVVWLKGQ